MISQNGQIGPNRRKAKQQHQWQRPTMGIAEKECQALVSILTNALREMKDPNKALLLNLINISTIWLEHSRKRTCLPALEQITVAIWRDCSSFKWASKSLRTNTPAWK